MILILPPFYQFRISVKNWILLLVVAWSFLLVGHAFAKEESSTPGEIVGIWLKVYPNDLEHAAELTTLSFRQGVTKKDWIATQKPLLSSLRLRYSNARVKYQDVGVNEARVIAQVRISSFFMGDHLKEELYYLKKGMNGSWLVNRVEEYNGDVLR